MYTWVTNSMYVRADGFVTLTSSPIVSRDRPVNGFEDRATQSL